MATDTRQIVRNLSEFYDFAGKAVVDVGAGGGQLVEYARPARRVIAVDPDLEALHKLAVRLETLGMTDRFSSIAADVIDVSPAGDVVLFEFCLRGQTEIAIPMPYRLFLLGASCSVRLRTSAGASESSDSSLPEETLASLSFRTAYLDNSVSGSLATILK